MLMFTRGSRRTVVYLPILLTILHNIQECLHKVPDLVTLSCRDRFAAIMGEESLPRPIVALLVLLEMDSNSSASSLE